MPPDDRLEQLLTSYRTLRDQGRPASAADLCRDCPELTQTLQRRIDEFESAATIAPAANQASLSPPTLPPATQAGDSLPTRAPRSGDARPVVAPPDAHQTVRLPG